MGCDFQCCFRCDFLLLNGAPDQRLGRGRKPRGVHPSPLPCEMRPKALLARARCFAAATGGEDRRADGGRGRLLLPGERTRTGRRADGEITPKRKGDLPRPFLLPSFRPFLLLFIPPKVGRAGAGSTSATTLLSAAAASAAPRSDPQSDGRRARRSRDANQVSGVACGGLVRVCEDGKTASARKDLTSAAASASVDQGVGRSRCSKRTG